MGSIRRMTGSERGIALPMAMVMLVVLTAMMVAFAVLARTEPTIAANQLATAQALHLADAGLQLAMWGLTNSTDANMGVNLAALAHTDPASAAGGKYDGASFITLGGTGGFTVRITWEPGNGTYERTVTTVGWTPLKDAGFVNTHRKIQAVVQMGLIPPLDLPCVVCVAGEVQVNGSAAAFDSSSGGCPGKNPPQYAIQTVNGTTYNAHPTFTGYGTSGTAALNTTTDTSQFKYAADSLAKFKAYAQAHNTYYRGAVSSLPLGPGPFVVFIDTVDGTDFTNSTPTGNDGSLTLSSNDTFNGTVIVAGTANISGTPTINGLVYALNDLSISGHVTVTGGMVSENRRDTSSTNIDTDYSGNIQMNYNCTNIRNIPFSSAWVMKTGGYLEQTGY